MKVAIFQFSTVWMDIEANLALISQQCSMITGQADLLVLPEMFNTGYTMSPHEIPPQWQTITISRLTSLAQTYNLTFAGTIPMYKDDKWYNTFIIVDHTGLIHQYDKIHLFAMAGEDKVYTAGIGSSYFESATWKILPLVCYDLRFPYLSFTQDQPDVLLYSANWPETRVHHWQSLLIARAIENQCYVIGVNRTGTDENGYVYPGNSLIIDYNGTILSRLDENPSFAIVELDKDLLHTFREKLPFIKDRKY